MTQKVSSLFLVSLLQRKTFYTNVGGDDWLQNCQISVCPSGELIALAHAKQLVVLSAKWNGTSGLNQFHITYTGMPNETDVIKAVLCVPIVEQSKNSHVSCN